MAGRNQIPQRGASRQILARLKNHPALAAILPANPRIVSGSENGGGWGWLIECEDFHVGSEHSRREVATAPGLFFSLVTRQTDRKVESTNDS